jgi:hypothetical protein
VSGGWFDENRFDQGMSTPIRIDNGPVADYPSQSLTVTDAPSSTSSAKTSDTVSLKTVDKPKSTAAASSSSKSFGPEEICNVDGQSISNKEGKRVCIPACERVPANVVT